MEKVVSMTSMLFFLGIAAKKRYVIDEYIDNPVGIMSEDSDGKFAMTTVTLKVQVIFSEKRKPSFEQLEKMHHQSHELCFIANSVKTAIATEIIL